MFKSIPLRSKAHALDLGRIKAAGSGEKLSVAACSTPGLLVLSEVVPRFCKQFITVLKSG